MLQKNEIRKIYGTDYADMTTRLLEEADLAGLIGDRGRLVGIKPNLVCPTPADFGATTHPEVVEGIVRYLTGHGFRNLVIAEGSWVGDRTSEAYEYCGYRALCETYGVPFTDTKKEKARRRDCAGMTLSVTEIADRIDFLINVPVLKGHCQTHMTCALKNLKGLLPDSEKRRFHTMGLHKPIAHLNAGVRQDFIVVDHICGDPDFEEGGNPVVKNCVMAARDPVLVDSYACSLLGLSADDVPYVRMAEALGVGSADLAEAVITTAERDGEASAEDEAPSRRLLDVSYMVDEVDSCSACYASLVPALLKLKEEGLLEHFPGRIGIGQGHRGKSGEIGIGNCTKAFSYSVKGCPPDPETVYRELREFLAHKGCLTEAQGR